MRDVAVELEFLLGSKPASHIVAEASEWLERYPDGDISEWVYEMQEIGAL